MYQDFELRDSPNLILDMSHVQHLDSVGLNIFMSNLLHVIGDKTFDAFKLLAPIKAEPKNALRTLGLLEILENYRLRSHQGDLWNDNSPRETVDQKPADQCLIEIVNGPLKSRDDQLANIRRLVKAFFGANGGWSINQGQLLLMITEIVKNTLDHTKHNAFLGLSIEYSDGNPSRLKMSYCELGFGLSRTLREKRQVDDPTTRGIKGSFADLIHWALKAGNSTKIGNGINHGIGLTMITQSAKALQMTLCMIDAKSMVSLDQLPSEPTHASLRSNISSVARQGCFTYIGSIRYDNNCAH
jgi:hypothetical protein